MPRTSRRESSRPPARVSRGFTVIELMVVVAIVAVLVALMMPTIQQALRSSHVVDAAEELMGLVDFARVQAQARNRAYELRFDVATGTAEVNESASTRCSGFPTSAVCDATQGCKGVRKAVFGTGTGDWKDVVIQAMAPSTWSSRSLCFQPDGRVLDTQTGLPVQPTATGYGAGEARITLQLKGSTAVVPQTVVVPYNGLPRRVPGG